MGHDTSKAEFYKKVSKIQKTLNAPKGQFNAFAKYNYRSCEDILQALKGVLGDLLVTVSDDIQIIGERVYVKSTATISDGVNEISTTSFARESLTKKGQDEAQITGSTSSYARKYALNGLLLIDDNKDADSRDNSSEGYTLTNTDKQWIEAVKKDIGVLNTITDANYKELIKKEAGL